MSLINCIDLTLLDENATEQQLKQLSQQANLYPVAALCVFDKHLKITSTSKLVKLATVINFPSGNQPIDHCLSQIEQAKINGATEVDYVFPYLEYLAGHKKNALKQFQLISEYCKKNHLILKVIIESGAFTSMSEIYDVSQELLGIGCHFIKTSTGKTAHGASFAAAFSIVSAIKDSEMDSGIKVSGGVKTPLQAYQFANLAEFIMDKPISKNWFRIGASGLLKELITSMKE